MSEGYEIMQVDTAEKELAKCAGLLANVFGKPELFTPEYITWQYADNPDGEIVGYNAIKEGVLAAHYVTQPLLAMVEGKVRKGLLSLNTATHPSHQGKGLFVGLAERTYQLAVDQGYSFVIGVANQNSVHGFVKKLGFHQVGQLHALLGMGPLPYSEDISKFSYSRIWSQKALDWRLNNPVAKYGVTTGKHITVSSPTAYPGIKAILGTFDGTKYKESDIKSGTAVLNLWIGANKDISKGARTYFNIPHRFRPAPLYLIFKSLTMDIHALNFEDIYFQALDFDAY